MKAILIALTALLLLAPMRALTQDASQPTAPEKKVVITKRYRDKDGKMVSETVVKKGKAAEAFDMEAYLSENDDPNLDIQVRVEGDEDAKVRIVERQEKRIIIDSRDKSEGPRVYEWEEDDQNSRSETVLGGRGFLGVEPDSDEDKSAPGLRVDVVRGSAAQKAGLRNNDLIIRLNDTPINNWEDLTRFMERTKNGDQVRIAYERNGQSYTTTATLGRKGETLVKTLSVPKKGFLGINLSDDYKGDKKMGVCVTVIAGGAAEKAGIRDKDVIRSLNNTPIYDWEDISDFLSETQAGDSVRVGYERRGEKGFATAYLGEQKAWDWNVNWDGLRDLDINVRTKAACLGVYSEDANTGDNEGARIQDFTSNSAALDANLRVGDIIIAINGNRVRGDNSLWNEIAKYQPDERIEVTFLRNGKEEKQSVILRGCRDQARVIISGTDSLGNNSRRDFFTWNWDKNTAERLREKRVITIQKGDEGDAGKITPPDRTGLKELKLQSYRAAPNGTAGQINVEFTAEPVSTTVTLYDVNGRQLFREELNAFSGRYSQVFDLVAYTKSTVLVQVQQGDRVFVEQLVVQ